MFSVECKRGEVEAEWKPLHGGARGWGKFSMKKPHGDPSMEERSCGRGSGGGCSVVAMVVVAVVVVL